MKGRRLQCTECWNEWEILGNGAHTVDPDLYVCADCLNGQIQQLPLDEMPRRETRVQYDPSQAEIPY